ncbi:MAG: hypothetical protein HQK49_19975 [Oligoflexia bacterium]|nr:hypothetical protein [Oligoflexia bacterium]
MSGLIKLALRNIGRHPGKNFLVGIVIFLANLIFLLAASLTEETINSWQDYFSSTFLGRYHLSVYQGPETDHSLAPMTFPKYAIEKSVINYLDKEKIVYSPRLKLGAAVFNETTNTFEGDLVTLVGIRWSEEIKHLYNLKLEDGNLNLDTDLTKTDLKDGKVFVWKDLAQKLNWKVGDTITLYIKDKQSGTYPYSYQIKGILGQHKSANIEGKGLMTVFPMVFVDFDFLNNQLGVDDQVYEVAITDTKISAKQISKLENTSQNISQKLSFYSSIKGFGAIYGIVDFINFITKFLKGLILIILIVSVFNLNMMGIFDRQKEIATILAIGATRGWILSLLLIEHLIFATLIFIITILFYYFLVLIGIVLPMGELSVIMAGNNFKISLIPYSLLEAYAGIAITLFISGIYPAYLASKMEPAEVFREANI